MKCETIMKCSTITSISFLKAGSIVAARDSWAMISNIVGFIWVVTEKCTAVSAIIVN